MKEKNNNVKNLLLIGNFLSKKLLTKSYFETLSIKLKEKNYFIYTTSSFKNRYLKVLNMFWNIIKLKKKYDLAIVDVFSNRAFLWAEYSAKFLRILRKNYILLLEGGNLPEFSKDRKERVKDIFYFSKKIIAPSEYLKKEMEGYGREIIVIPYAIEIGSYPYKLKENISAKIIWIRAFHKTYNPFMAIEVLKILKMKYPDIFLCMIGPDKKDGSLEEVLKGIDNFGLEKNIEIIRGVEKEKIPEYLNEYDIFINTTNVDNTPVTVIEAMACGLCIVSTNVGGIPFLLKDKKDSLLVPKGDSKSMADAILSLLKDPALCQTLSKNARKKAESFAWENVLPLWKKVINE